MLNDIKIGVKLIGCFVRDLCNCDGDDAVRR